MITPLNFNKLEVLAFLEDMIRSGEANNEEIRIYEEFQWGRNLDKQIHKKLEMKMKKLWKQVYL